MIRPNTSFEVTQYFDNDGPLSKHLTGFEPRPEQIEMAAAVHKAFLNHRRLMVEAGTGVGKSFAYLIPAIHDLARHNSKVIISTFTITLQQQLISKDVPALKNALNKDFSAELAKGRANYICLRRLKFALRRSRTLFTQLSDELEEINQWAQKTEDGSLSDIPFVPSSQAWDEVRSEHGNCLGRKCDYYNDCFWRRARRKLDSADIIIANHAMLFSDLALKEQGFDLLPKYDYVIIDEAHNIENVAQDHFGINLSNRRVSYLLDKLYNSRTKRGFLSYTRNTEKCIELVKSANTAASSFFANVRKWYEQYLDQTGGRCYKNFVDDTLSGYLKPLRSQLSSLADNTQDRDEKFEIMRYADLTASLIIDLQNFLSQELHDQVYWIELGGGKSRTVRLKSAPLNVGSDIKRTLFDVYESVVLTSATLSCDDGRTDGFDFMASRLGLEDYDGLKLGSPFDYENNVTLYIEKDLPDPNNKLFLDAATDAIKKYIEKSLGRAFVLFTSYDMLNKIGEKLLPWFVRQGYNFFSQGDGTDRSVLLKDFTSQDKSVLFGTDSFWQGVDVPGEPLSNVIIVKLPFAVPNHPLVAGRIEQIKNKGGNPFFDYQLPSAVIKFKQGFGRLIRSKNDRGIVAVLDSRIVNRRYGGQFLSAIPKCKVEIVSSAD